MTSHDIYLLSPEISVAALAVIVLLLDLVVVRKGYLAAVAILGLAVPLGHSARSSSPTVSLSDIKGRLRATTRTLTVVGSPTFTTGRSGTTSTSSSARESTPLLS